MPEQNPRQPILTEFLGNTDIHQLKLTMYKMLVLKFTETRTEQYN